MNQNASLWAILFILIGIFAFIVLVLGAVFTQGFASGVFSTLAGFWFFIYCKMIFH